MSSDNNPVTGVEVLYNLHLNKGTAFTEEERDRLKIRGLLPPRVFSQEEQLQRILGNFERKSTDLDRYVFLIGLQDRNERLFYKTLMEHIDLMLPIVYTPTVGEACKNFAHIFRRPRGLYVTADDRGRIADVLRNWPRDEVSVIVVTDGERILGLGDLGASGMGIPIGKLSLYTACAGIDPKKCLPIMLDVGTENEGMRNDELYLGLQQKRLRGSEYLELVDEFVDAVQEVFPHALIQFEDFATGNAVRLLQRYRDRACMFNDDIQGTAAVTLAGLLAATRLTDVSLPEQQVLFLGAGSAATGIAHLVAAAMSNEDLTEEEARRRCWFIDSKGLVVASRTDLAEHKQDFAHDHPFIEDVESVIDAIRPTALIGVSGQPGTFTEPILRKMAKYNEHPIVFALSNPTSKAECTAEEAYSWTDGRAVFASGSPFGPVNYGGRTFVPGQGNNAYIFPGVGLGIVASGATRVTDEMFHRAAEVLADAVEDASFAQGTIFPPFTRIREVSARIGCAVAEIAFESGLSEQAKPVDLKSHVESFMYSPEYSDGT